MNIVEIKVTLKDVKPRVSRVLQVSADIWLDELHLTLQAAMGWENSHLYMFVAGPVTWGLPDPDFAGGDDLYADDSTLSDVIKVTGKKTIKYIYDFGDSWDHTIKIGKFSDPDPGELYPRLLKATGKCPPEDVGGCWGYENFLAAIADPDHPEHEDFKDWYDGDFNPDQPETDVLKHHVLTLAKSWESEESGS